MRFFFPPFLATSLACLLSLSVLPPQLVFTHLRTCLVILPSLCLCCLSPTSLLRLIQFTPCPAPVSLYTVSFSTTQVHWKSQHQTCLCVSISRCSNPTNFPVAQGSRDAMHSLLTLAKPWEPRTSLPPCPLLYNTPHFTSTQQHVNFLGQWVIAWNQNYYQFQIHCVLVMWLWQN